MARFVIDGQTLEYEPGDSLAMALFRARQHPSHGGTLCLAGDCGSCAAEVDGTAFVRTCQTMAKPGMVVNRHPAIGNPSIRSLPQKNVVETPVAPAIPVRRRSVEAVVIGASDTGHAIATMMRDHGHEVTLLDASSGSEVVGIYAGPTVIVRDTAGALGSGPDTGGALGSGPGMTHLHAHRVAITTGAAELHPVCEGNTLKGIVTKRAAEKMLAAGVELPVMVTVTQTPKRIISRDNGWVREVVLANGETVSCNTLVVDLGRAPRDLLARMANDPKVTVHGPAAERYALPPCPTAGTICPCSRITVEDVDGVWARGFRELELVKRSALVGTGTCQGGVCLPHLQAYVNEHSGAESKPFTARPIARQLTIGEAAAGTFIDAFRRTPLHDEHLALGASMDRFGGWWRPWNYGDFLQEYWAVREAVSLGDVSTLGKMIIDGPDALEVLERLYPNNVHDIKPGRSRYVLLLNERGHLLDDGMICRETGTRFVLTFTSGGASFAEMWVRDWIETWGLDAHIIDRTTSLAAINVTGPFGAELLKRVGVAEPPKFLQHAHLDVAGVPCHVMRLSFTGEASWELHHPIDRSAELWRALMHAGADLGIRPHGLQALFALRLEKGHVIVGMDSELDSSPRRLQLDWAVKMDKPYFVGREALARVLPLPDHRKLFGFTMDGVAPVEGAPIYDGDDIVGHVASSFTSPLLGHAVMLGWLKRMPFPTQVTVDGRLATVAHTPFYDKEGRRARA